MQRVAQPANPVRRAHSWLPDAELDAHPVGSWLLEMGFDLWIQVFYNRVILLPPDFHVAPGTLIASNHQRDVDGPMLGTLLVRRKGLRFQWPLPFFATREDLFRPGILARLTVHWPKPLSTLLGRISLAWFFPLGRTEPMRRVREFTLGETLRALCEAGCGGGDCRILLNARGCRELGVMDNVTLHALLARADLTALEQWWGLRRLTAHARKKIAPAFRSAINAQLGHFAVRLNRGRCVFFSPEGTISMDGHFGRIRAGFFRLAHMAETTPWIQPMALGYDTLAPGRSRVVVRIGECFRADTALGRRAFDARLRGAVLALAPITPSHLIARFLLHGPETFTLADFAGWLARCRDMLKSSGASLDPLFANGMPEQLATRRLRWLRGKRLVTRENASFRNTCPRGATPGWRKPANIIHYLDNSLTDLVPELPSC